MEFNDAYFLCKESCDLGDLYHFEQGEIYFFKKAEMEELVAKYPQLAQQFMGYIQNGMIIEIKKKTETVFCVKAFQHGDDYYKPYHIYAITDWDYIINQFVDDGLVQAYKRDVNKQTVKALYTFSDAVTGLTMAEGEVKTVEKDWGCPALREAWDRLFHGVIELYNPVGMMRFTMYCENSFIATATSYVTNSNNNRMYAESYKITKGGNWFWNVPYSPVGSLYIALESGNDLTFSDAVGCEYVGAIKKDNRVPVHFIRITSSDGASITVKSAS